METDAEADARVDAEADGAYADAEAEEAPRTCGRNNRSGIRRQEWRNNRSGKRRSGRTDQPSSGSTGVGNVRKRRKRHDMNKRMGREEF